MAKLFLTFSFLLTAVSGVAIGWLLRDWALETPADRWLARELEHRLLDDQTVSHEEATR